MGMWGTFQEYSSLDELLRASCRRPLGADQGGRFVGADGAYRGSRSVFRRAVDRTNKLMTLPSIIHKFGVIRRHLDGIKMP